MKIAHIVDSMDVGGAEMLVSQMCRLQKELGHDPCVYAIAGLGALGSQMRKEGFTVQPNVGRHLTDSISNFFRLFKKSPPDVVHLHNPTPTIYAAMAARLAGVPSIVSTRHSLVAPPRNAVVEMKYAIAAKFCDWVVGICDATTENVKSIHTIPARKIVRIYNGATPLERVANEDCPPKDGFTLVFVGRLEPVKNHALLLHAFQQALSAESGLRLWMVGDGSQRARLEDLTKELGIEHRVTFWGQQLNVAPFFSGADTFIMSSRSEGLPVSLLQAFSLGLPAIVTNVGGMAETVRIAEAGLIVSATDPAEMAAAILRLARDQAQLREFSKNAEQAFNARFTLKTMVDSYLDLYRNTARASRMSTN